MFLEINTRDVDDFANRLSSNINGIAERAQTKWMNRAIDGIVGTVGQYPEETSANRPPPPYYIRGVGRVLSGGKILFTSGILNAQWRTKLTVSKNGVAGEISNRAVNPLTGNVYSSWVHGVPGAGQARIHTQRGWPSLLNVTLAAVGETTAQVVYSGRTRLEGNPEEIGEQIAREIERLGT